MSAAAMVKVVSGNRSACFSRSFLRCCTQPPPGCHAPFFPTFSHFPMLFLSRLSLELLERFVVSATCWPKWNKYFDWNLVVWYGCDTFRGEIDYKLEHAPLAISWRVSRGG